MEAACPSSGCGICSGCKRTSTWLKKMVPLLLTECGSFTESDDTRDSTPCRRAGDEFKCFSTCVGSGLNSSFPLIRSPPSLSPSSPLPPLLLSVIVASLLSLSLSFPLSTYSPTSSSLSIPTRTLPRAWSRLTPPSSSARPVWPASPLPLTPLAPVNE